MEEVKPLGQWNHWDSGTIGTVEPLGQWNHWDSGTSILWNLWDSYMYMYSIHTVGQCVLIKGML